MDRTPSSAVNFRLSSSAIAPGAPSGMTNASYWYEQVNMIGMPVQ
jgi:hypothetical protein